MNLRKFAELGTTHRGDPCQEYPGVWYSYVDGKKELEFATFEQAKTNAYDRWEYGAGVLETTVCWQASLNDPRIGKNWFTSFYQHGKFDIFGRYVET